MIMACIVLDLVLLLMPAANQSDISDRQWGKHGGWADGSTAQTGYVLDSASNALTVPKALAL